MLEHGFSVAGFLGADEQLGFGLAWAAGFLFAWGLPQPQYREFSVVFRLEQRKSRGTNRLRLQCDTIPIYQPCCPSWQVGGVDCRWLSLGLLACNLHSVFLNLVFLCRPWLLLPVVTFLLCGWVT